MHFNSDFFIRRAFYSRLAYLFATTLGREMPEVKRSPPALCVRQETQCRADKKCSYIVNLWGGPLPGLMGPKTGHGSPRSEILATPMAGRYTVWSIVLKFSIDYGGVFCATFRGKKFGQVRSGHEVMTS